MYSVCVHFSWLDIFLQPTEELFAFHYCSAIRHPNPNFIHNTSLPNFFKLQGQQLYYTHKGQRSYWLGSKVIMVEVKSHLNWGLRSYTLKV